MAGTKTYNTFLFIQVFCIKDGEKQEDPSACEADGMPLSDEPCEAPCPALNETMEGSGNGTANATETEEPEDTAEKTVESDVTECQQELRWSRLGKTIACLAFRRSLKVC